METKLFNKSKRRSKTQTLTTKKNGASSSSQFQSMKTKKTAFKRWKRNSSKNWKTIKKSMLKSRCPSKESWTQTCCKLQNKFMNANLVSSDWPKPSNILWNFTANLTKITSTSFHYLSCNSFCVVSTNSKSTLTLLKMTVRNIWRKLLEWWLKNKRKLMKALRMPIKKINKQVSIWRTLRFSLHNANRWINK